VNRGRSGAPNLRTWPAAVLLLFALLGTAIPVSGACEDRGEAPVGGTKLGASGGASDLGPGLLRIDATALPAVIRRSDSKVVVVNVWATWCVPCREELPDLLRVYRRFGAKGMGLILVSADFDDQAESARAFLRRQGVDFPSYIKAGDDEAFIDGLSREWSGALPATFVYDGKGQLRDWREGKADLRRFERAVQGVLEQPDAGHR